MFEFEYGVKFPYVSEMITGWFLPSENTAEMSSGKIVLEMVSYEVYRYA